MGAHEQGKTRRKFSVVSPKFQDAVKLVGGTVGRSKALHEPEAIFCPKEIDLERKFKPYRIAFLPFGLSVKKYGAESYQPGGGHPPPNAYILHEHRFDHFALCVNDGRGIDGIKPWADEVLARCEAALVARADFVVMSELSFPNFWPGRGEQDNQFADQRRLLRKLHSDLEDRLQKLASAYKAVIICGSYHDWETFENICPIYFPEAIYSRNHKKRTSAFIVNEHIKPAHSKKYSVYHSVGRSFCVLICTDAFDLNLFFRQAIESSQPTGRMEMKPEIYFVPSFYEKDRGGHALRSACEQLSLATGQVVIFVNHTSDLEGLAAFVAGDYISPQPQNGIPMVELDPSMIAERAQKSEDMRKALSEILSANVVIIKGGKQPKKPSASPSRPAAPSRTPRPGSPRR